jgi:hypothetical protein
MFLKFTHFDGLTKEEKEHLLNRLIQFVAILFIIAFIAYLICV